MDFFIKKIFEGAGTDDELVHLQFQKFSRGDFKNRAMILAKKLSNKFSINTTPEYANGFIRCLAEKLGETKAAVTGVIISTKDLTGELDFQDKKQFMGIKKYILEREMSGNEILSLCDKFPNSFVGLSFKTEDSELKVKPKAPKSAKPSTKGEGKPKIDFCKLKTTDEELVKKIIFDEELKMFNFKEVEIGHDFLINEIVVSDELKKEVGNDFEKIRKMAKRKGKIIRRFAIDSGEEIKKEIDFEA